jgi:hypothetical protein
VSEQTRPETAIATLDQPRRRPDVWPIDMLKGAVIGDYAKRLGVTGYVTQGVLGFVPVVGSCCAFRDLLANWGKGDGRGMLLNAISLLPVVGGISKTAHAIRGIKNVSQVYGAADNVVGAMLKK